MTVDHAILKTLAYFDIFNYPITANEILKFLPEKSNMETVQNGLNTLTTNGTIQKKDDYYSLLNKHDIFEIRNKDNRSAAEAMPLALEQAKKIKEFPFVRDVLISGSLSKGVMKSDSDLDYFIIAAPNRIWLSKLFLKGYKFLYHKNRRDHFCMNYFIAENDLSIKEQNIFTATEIVTLIAADENSYKTELLHSNKWIANILPQAYVTDLDSPDRSKIHITTTEKILKGSLGDILNKFIQKTNVIRNNIKYKKLKESKDYELMMRSSDTQIKVHNSNHQRIVLDKYISRLEKFDLDKKFVSIHA